MTHRNQKGDQGYFVIRAARSIRYLRNSSSSVRKYEPASKPKLVARVFRVDASTTNSGLSNSGNDCNA